MSLYCLKPSRSNIATISSSSAFSPTTTFTTCPPNSENPSATVTVIARTTPMIFRSITPVTSIPNPERALGITPRPCCALTLLMQVEAIGPQTATALVASMGDPHVFKSGRSYAASLGITPRQNSSGGTDRLGPVMQEWGSQNGIPVKDLLPEMDARVQNGSKTDYMSYFLACDGHWSAKGDAVAAQILEPWLAEK